MADISPIYIVEPIARGFRLDVMAKAISAIREYSRRPIYIVTRADFACRELAHRIPSSWTDVHFVSSSLDLHGGNVAAFDSHAADALLGAVAEVRAQARRADLVFLGADDYLGVLAMRWPAYRARLSHTRQFVFLYNTEDLVAGQLDGSSPARLAREAIASIQVLDATLLAFDEGLRGQRISERAVKVLPDPWHGHFTHTQRVRAREAIGLGPNALLVTWDVDLLLNERDSSWLADAERFAQVPFIRFALCGDVWTLRNPAFGQLVNRFGDRIVHLGPSPTACGDVNLMAATDLLLSRATGPRCCAQHEPVATATHACAARRVRATELGGAFDRDVRRILLDSVDALSAISSVSMKLMRDELDRLANERLNRAFGVQLRSAIRRPQ